MSLLTIRTAPDPVLKQTAAPVAVVDDGVRQLMVDMLETMYAANGIGLAAPQVGVSRRVIVVDTTWKKENSEHHVVYQMANPEITWVSEEDGTYEEGCLSVPTHYADVVRPAEIRVQYLDFQGQPQEIFADGLLATCIQHEIDHLDGILFIDHLSALKRNIILRKLLKAKKEMEVRSPL
ncbi:MAG: peptide deformylase [Holosporales bacterium]|jgi:peptide deformylase